MRSFVIRVCYGFKSFLSCSVPNLNYIKLFTYNLIVFPFKSKVLILKSTPIVGRKLSLKTLSANLNSKEDLPTAELPISKILKRKSYSCCILIYFKLICSDLYRIYTKKGCIISILVSIIF